MILLLEAVLPYALRGIGKRLFVQSLQADVVVVRVSHGFELEVCARKRVRELGDGGLFALWFRYSVKDRSVADMRCGCGCGCLGQTYMEGRH